MTPMAIETKIDDEIRRIARESSERCPDDSDITFLIRTIQCAREALKQIGVATLTPELPLDKTQIRAIVALGLHPNL